MKVEATSFPRGKYDGAACCSLYRGHAQDDRADLALHAGAQRAIYVTPCRRRRPHLNPILTLNDPLALLG